MGVTRIRAIEIKFEALVYGGDSINISLFLLVCSFPCKRICVSGLSFERGNSVLQIRVK